MVKHIFIATIKDEVLDEDLEKEMELMRSMKESVPEIKDIVVEKSTGWVGLSDVVIMIIECENKESFEKILSSEAHNKVSATAADYFRTDNFILSQIETEEKDYE